MSDAANFTEQEQWELDNEDPIMGLWRMRNEARAAARAAAPPVSESSTTLCP